MFFNKGSPLRRGFIMDRKAKQEKTDFTVIVEDQYGNILTDEDLRHIVIEDTLFYERMKVINKRIKEQYGFEKVY